MRELESIETETCKIVKIKKISIRSLPKMKFVKASSNDDNTTSLDDPKSDSQIKQNEISVQMLSKANEAPAIDVSIRNSRNGSSATAQCQSGTSISVADRRSNSNDINPAGSSDFKEMESKFYMLSNAIKDVYNKAKNARNEAEIIQMAADKTKMTITSQFHDRLGGVFHCQLFFDFVLVATGEAKNKKSSKFNAFQKAAELLNKPYLRVDKLNSQSQELVLMGSLEPFKQVYSSKQRDFDLKLTKLGQVTPALVNKNASRKRPGSNISDVLTEFVLIECWYSPNTNPISVLKQSADFSHYEVTFALTDLPQGMCQCQVLIGGQVFVDIVDSSKLTAKTKAAEKALEKLRKSCYTILFKQATDADANDAIQKEGFANKQNQDDARIPESNIGNKLLKKMGWIGGGVGKEGNEGISDPVSLDAVINREGLGLQTQKGIDRNFVPKIEETILNYMKSDKQEDLVFSPSFSKDERAIIHQKSRKYHLKAKSYGKDDDRYLVLSRKRTPLELVAHIRANGGETCKYLLKSPEEIPSTG